MKTISIRLNNLLYHFIGALFIFLNYMRHSIFGYNTPRSISIHQHEHAINYDFEVVAKWIKHLHLFGEDSTALRNKVVLELGPGPDLGIGLILLAMGIKKYIALDVNNLARDTPAQFYQKLFNKLKIEYPYCDVKFLNEQLSKCYKHEGERMVYLVDQNFDVLKIKDTIDIVFSHVTFEHFANIHRTFKDLSHVVRSKGILISEIDLKTHTRWIRDKDPLNIYRYNDTFWNFFKFNGSPNRMRSFDYTKLLERYGWQNIKVEPLAVLEDESWFNVKTSLNKKFREIGSIEMKMLRIMLLATKI